MTDISKQGVSYTQHREFKFSPNSITSAVSQAAPSITEEDVRRIAAEVCTEILKVFNAGDGCCGKPIVPPLGDDRHWLNLTEATKLAEQLQLRLAGMNLASMSPLIDEIVNTLHDLRNGY